MKKTLFMLLLILVISALWSQNGTPTMPMTQISVPGNRVMDFVIIGNYGYIANDSFLNKYDLASKEIIWSQPFPDCYSNINGQGMFKTADNYLVFTYDGIVTKMSAEDDTLWQIVLPGKVALSYDQTRNRIVCYSQDGLLTVLNLSNGQTLLQKQMPFEGLPSCSNHSVIAVSESEFILSDDTIYGINWNSGVMVSKVSIVNNVVNVIWQHSMPDLITCNIKSLGNNRFYVSVREITIANNAKIFFFEDNGSTYTITDSIDAGGPNSSVFLESTLPIGNNVLTAGSELLGELPENGTQAIFTIYDSTGETRTSQINNQSDIATYQGLAENNGHLYTILVSRDYIGGPCTFYLVELTSVYNSAVSTDPDTPVIPQLSLTCYPTPTRVGNKVNVRFETKSKDITTIEVYNIKGQKVRTLVNSNFSSGQHQTVWNGRTDNGTPVSSGMYFFRMKSGIFSATRKVILLK
ncbi:MAG TPA: FlgD immunoglobulin-like domain containing protein [bacterium]|nr:FlgD immunoglobulin-like domain containing protein [bacterium]